jgi:hypothetical protein
MPRGAPQYPTDQLICRAPLCRRHACGYDDKNHSRAARLMLPTCVVLDMAPRTCCCIFGHRAETTNAAVHPLPGHFRTAPIWATCRTPERPRFDSALVPASLPSSICNRLRDSPVPEFGWETNRFLLPPAIPPCGKCTQENHLLAT